MPLGTCADAIEGAMTAAGPRLPTISNAEIAFVRLEDKALMLRCDISEGTRCIAALLGRFLPRLGPLARAAFFLSNFPTVLTLPRSSTRGPGHGCGTVASLGRGKWASTFVVRRERSALRS